MMPPRGAGPDELHIARFLHRVSAQVQAHALWAPEARLLLAVSGGPDSTALLDALATLAPATALTLAVAHINHSLRPEAAAEADFVAALAARYGLPFHTATVDVPARVAATGESVEEAARLLRYDALQALARATGMTTIVTGHTADDQAETVLMRVLRGTGVTGLAGIPPKRDNIVRPLLTLWRAEVEAYLAARGITACADASNLSTDFTRNRLRLELLPALERDYAPRLRERLAHLATQARYDTQALDGWAETTYRDHRVAIPGGIALPLLPDLPQAIRWRTWRVALADVRGDLEGIGYEHLEAIAALAAHEETHLPGARVLHEAGRLVFLPATAPAPCLDEVLLPVPGTICLPAAACCLAADAPPTLPPLAGGDNTALLDAAAIAGALRVRGWQPGDRYRPLGAPGSRKLQDIFVDAGVPRRLRGGVPVISDDNGICWLAGFRIADRVKITPNTAHALRLRVTWELNPWTLKHSNDA